MSNSVVLEVKVCVVKRCVRGYLKVAEAMTKEKE